MAYQIKTNKRYPNDNINRTMHLGGPTGVNICKVPIPYQRQTNKAAIEICNSIFDQFIHISYVHIQSNLTP